MQLVCIFIAQSAWRNCHRTNRPRNMRGSLLVGQRKDCSFGVCATMLMCCTSCSLCKNQFDGTAPLFVPWSGRRVFCNPPYGPGIKSFLERASEADVAVFLLPARTDTLWFHNLVLPFAKEIRFVKGRLHFNEAGSAPFPSMVVVFENVNKL